MRHNSDLPGQRRTGVMGRIIKTLFQFYPVLMPTVVVCIILVLALFIPTMALSVLSGS